MIITLIFIIGSVIYAVVATFAVRATTVFGHRGDYTMPVTIAFLIVSVSVWGASLWLLLTMDLPAVLR
jgi:hypothetical protein